MTHSAPGKPLPSIANVDNLMRRFYRELQWEAPSDTSTLPAPIDIELSDLRPGTDVEFKLGSVAVNMLLEGWSDPEENYIWSNGLKSSMEIPVFRDRPTVLHFKLHPFLPPGTSLQRVDLFANGHRIAIWSAAEPGEYSVVVPLLQEDSAKAVLTWHFPNAVSPSASGLSADSRLLAVALQSARLQPL